MVQGEWLLAERRKPGEPGMLAWEEAPGHWQGEADRGTLLFPSVFLNGCVIPVSRNEVILLPYDILSTSPRTEKHKCPVNMC